MEAATLRSEIKYSQKVPNLHNEMVRKLSREIAPCRSMMIDWNNLLQLFSNDAPLSNVQIDSISSVGDLVRLLLGENYISYDNYEPFAKKLADVFPRMATLVRKDAQKIMEQIRTEKKGWTINDQCDMDSSQRIQILENEMVVELSQFLDPQLKDDWADFDCRLKTYLSRVCTTSLTNIHQAFNALKNNKVIRIGDYKVLRDMVNPIHVKMGKIIDKYTARMQTEDG